MKVRWPGCEPYTGSFHDLIPLWQEFWAKRPDKEALPEAALPAPLEKFLETLSPPLPHPRFVCAEAG